MASEEEMMFDRVVDSLDLPDPDMAVKGQIMKAVYFLLIAREVGVFHASIPGILLDDITNE